MKGIFASLILSIAFSSQAVTLTLAGGAGYKRPVTELSTNFEKVYNIKTEQFFGNMAQVLNQTKQSGDVALVIGDLSFLKRNKQVTFNHFATLGEGKLVLAYAKNKTLNDAKALLDDRFARIALPDTKKAIYGKAAVEFMASSGLSEGLQNKLLMVSSVPQVSGYLISGEVDAGFLNYTDVLAIKDKIGGFIMLDKRLYQPILISAGIVNGHENDPEVKSFEQFLVSTKARNIIAKHGL